MVAETRTGAMALGTMCLKIILQLGTPRAVAAVTKSCSRRDRNSALMNRAAPIQLVSPITAIMFKMLRSSRATTVRIRKKLGKQSMISIKPVMSTSTEKRLRKSTERPVGIGRLPLEFPIRMRKVAIPAPMRTIKASTAILPKKISMPPRPLRKVTTTVNRSMTPQPSKTAARRCPIRTRLLP